MGEEQSKSEKREVRSEKSSVSNLQSPISNLESQVSNLNWFCEWFDSKYYHILYKNRDFAEAERFLSNLIEFLQPKKSAKILDLACGKGRHSVYLNSKGFEVIGVDLSKNSIEEARKSANSSLSFFVHDMREPFLWQDFDLIINAFTSFGYFDDEEQDLKTLQNVRNALIQDGYFVFDFLNIDYLKNHLVTSETKMIDGISFSIQRYFKDDSLFKQIDFEDNNQNYSFTERVDALDFEKIKSYFGQTNLKIKHIFGDYDLREFGKKESQRLIIIAQK
jgi:SAM-dependent methyltransferase